MSLSAIAITSDAVVQRDYMQTTRGSTTQSVSMNPLLTWVSVTGSY
jgi:hypothetical protein